MGVTGLITGVAIFILCLFLAQALPEYLTALTSQTLDILKTFLLFLGVGAIFIGALK